MSNVFEVKDNKIYRHEDLIDLPAIYLDVIGTVHCVGSYEEVNKKFEHDCEKYKEAGLSQYTENLRLITFKESDPKKLRAIAVILNWITQCSGLGPQLINVLLNEELLLDKAKRLKEIGY